MKIATQSSIRDAFLGIVVAAVVFITRTKHKLMVSATARGVGGTGVLVVAAAYYVEASRSERRRGSSCNSQNEEETNGSF